MWVPQCDTVCIRYAPLCSAQGSSTVCLSFVSFTFLSISPVFLFYAPSSGPSNPIFSSYPCFTFFHDVTAPQPWQALGGMRGAVTLGVKVRGVQLCTWGPCHRGQQESGEGGSQVQIGKGEDRGVGKDRKSKQKKEDRRKGRQKGRASNSLGGVNDYRTCTGCQQF